MVHKNLVAICDDIDTEADEFGLSPTQAVDVFRLIWEKMTGGPYSLDIEEAITLIENTFGI